MPFFPLIPKDTSDRTDDVFRLISRAGFVGICIGELVVMLTQRGPITDRQLLIIIVMTIGWLLLIALSFVVTIVIQRLLHIKRGGR